MDVKEFLTQVTRIDKFKMIVAKIRNLENVKIVCEDDEKNKNIEKEIKRLKKELEDI